MNCSKCGYQLDAFDEVCPKCRHNPKSLAVTQPAPGSPAIPAQSTLSVPAPAARPVVKLSLQCPVCSNQQVQKVSAIYDAGTEYSTSRSQGTALSAGVGHIWNGGDFTTLGLSVSESRASHSSSTQLASQLSPPYLGSLPPEPKPPRYQGPPSVQENPLAGNWEAFLWGMGALFFGPLAYIIAIPVKLVHIRSA